MESNNIESKLEKHGFSKRICAKTDCPTILTKEGVWTLRIHEMIYLLFDTNDNFVTIMQKHESVKYYPGNPASPENEIRDLITLPKPIKTEEDLINLLNAIR